MTGNLLRLLISLQYQPILTSRRTSLWDRSFAKSVGPFETSGFQPPHCRQTLGSKEGAVSCSTNAPPKHSLLHHPHGGFKLLIIEPKRTAGPNPQCSPPPYSIVACGPRGTPAIIPMSPLRLCRAATPKRGVLLLSSFLLLCLLVRIGLGKRF